MAKWPSEISFSPHFRYFGLLTASQYTSTRRNLISRMPPETSPKRSSPRAGAEVWRTVAFGTLRSTAAVVTPIGPLTEAHDHEGVRSERFLVALSLASHSRPIGRNRRHTPARYSSPVIRAISRARPDSRGSLSLWFVMPEPWQVDGLVRSEDLDLLHFCGVLFSRLTLNNEGQSPCSSIVRSISALYTVLSAQGWSVMGAKAISLRRGRSFRRNLEWPFDKSKRPKSSWVILKMGIGELEMEAVRHLRSNSLLLNITYSLPESGSIKILILRPAVLKSICSISLSDTCPIPDQVLKASRARDLAWKTDFTSYPL